MSGQQRELIVHRDPCGDLMPYERLLRDAIGGDAPLFANAELVEPAWRVVDPMLGSAAPVEQYAADSSEPADADRIITDNGGRHNPTRDPRTP